MTHRKGAGNKTTDKMPFNSPSTSIQQQPMLPDNRCCFCLTLRTGTILIGLVNTVINVAGFIWYICSPTVQSSWTDAHSPVTNVDISYFVVVALQLVCNFVLILGAVKKMPTYTIPWLSVNVGLIAIFLVMITLLLFFGSIQTPLTQDEYISTLTFLGFLGAVLIFSWLVVFQFRKNLLDERRILTLFLAPSAPSPEGRAAPVRTHDGGLVEMPENYQRSASPPPSYDEASKVAMVVAASLMTDQARSSDVVSLATDRNGLKICLDEAPPEYCAAVSMPPIDLPLVSQNPSQPDAKQLKNQEAQLQPLSLSAKVSNPGEVSFHVEIDRPDSTLPAAK